MNLPELSLILASLLCTLVAGFLFSWAVVVMPGIGRLDDGAFIRAFQEMDGIIQRNPPLFVAVWLGSVLAVLTAAALGMFHLDATGKWLVIAATLAYLLGVQLPTFVINIPLNNHLQSLDLDAMDGPARKAARAAFESRWNRSNLARTWIACGVSLLLLLALSRL